MAEPMSRDRLLEISERAGGATDGPWGGYVDAIGRWDIAADLEETGTGYRCRRQIAQTFDDGIDNSAAHRGWDAGDHQYQVDCDAEFIIHARRDIPDLLAEVGRLRREIAELKRPAVERKREEIARSYAELAWQARGDGDSESAAVVEQRLRDREEQWRREDIESGWSS